jgi:hypothetical protein
MGTYALIASIAAEAVSAAAKSKAVGTQTQQVREQMTEERLQATQASQVRTKKAQQILGAQEVISASRGISPASGSLKATELNSYTNYLKDERTAQENLNMRENALQHRLDQLKWSEWSSIFSSAGNIGMDYWSMGGSSVAKGGGKAASSGGSINE